MIEPPVARAAHRQPTPYRSRPLPRGASRRTTWRAQHHGGAGVLHTRLVGDRSDWPAPPRPRWIDAGTTRTLQPRARATRRALLLAASRLIDEHGYTGAALSDITEASGATKGALYFHFHSKLGLAEALLTEVFATWDDVIHRIEELDLDPLATLLVYYDAYTGRLMYDIGARAALRIVQEDIGRHHAQRWTTHWEKTVENLLLRAHDTGLLRSGIDPAWLSRHVLATTTGQFQLSEGKPGGPTMWDRMNDTWTGLLPAVATPRWLTTWHASGWDNRPEPHPEQYRVDLQALPGGIVTCDTDPRAPR